MVRSAAWVCLAVGLVCVACTSSEEPTPDGDGVYIPQAVYCAGPSTATNGSPLCSVIPGDIGPDPMLDVTIAYNGIMGERPTSKDKDVQTPFDNLSWQTFVALNWTAGKESQPAEEGLASDGPRVWEKWPRVAEIFGDGPVQADCTVPEGRTVFSIASNGQGQPVGQNEEYIQAATDDPLIDVAGNWAVYERRINSVEVDYLEAPQGHPEWTLTTLEGQKSFVQAGNTVDFPWVDPDKGRATGAIEIKAAWRVLDPADRAQNEKRYYLVPAFLMVAPDLMTEPNGKGICAEVDMGLVAMHIIQKNPPTDNALKQEWFWSTFEHVDNVPLAQNACDPTKPQDCSWFGNLDCTADLSGSTEYSFFNRACPDCEVNQPPQKSSGDPEFSWNATPPYAKDYLISHDGTTGLGTQVSRCWQIYSLTEDLNQQWREQLAQVDSVFQNYMLVGTQWGASLTNPPDPKVPQNAVPGFLSNSVVETYLQTLYDESNPFESGSCVSCHAAAVLPADKTATANFSFLPFLAKPALVRQDLATMMAEDGSAPDSGE